MDAESQALLGRLGRLRRRTLLASGLAVLPVTVLVAASGWTLAAGAGWSTHAPGAALAWVSGWALALAGAWAALRRPTLAELALGLDRRLGSSETVVSALETLEWPDAVARVVRREALGRLETQPSRLVPLALPASRLAGAAILGAGLVWGGGDLLAWRLHADGVVDGGSTGGQVPSVASLTPRPAGDSVPRGPANDPRALGDGAIEPGAGEARSLNASASTGTGERPAGEAPIRDDASERSSRENSAPAERSAGTARPPEAVAEADRAPSRAGAGSPERSARGSSAGSADPRSAAATAGEAGDGDGGGGVETKAGGEGVTGPAARGSRRLAAAQDPALAPGEGAPVGDAVGAGVAPRGFAVYLREYLEAVRRLEGGR